MGAYINPKGVSKEDWLAMHFQNSSIGAPEWDAIPVDCYAVCLVQTSHGSAAGIAFDRMAYDIMNAAGDMRPKRWFIVSKDKLRPVSNLHEYEE